MTSHGSLVYVLNAGGSANITAFRLSSAGELTTLAGSTRPFSAAAPSPAQVEFTPAGDRLVVTEKATNLILTYAVGAGVLGGGDARRPLRVRHERREAAG